MTQRRHTESLGSVPKATRNYSHPSNGWSDVWLPRSGELASRLWRLSILPLRAIRGTRRGATGVVINNRGEVLSVRIDPPAAAPLDHGRAKSNDRGAGLRRPLHSVRWLAADPETGLTLLRLPSRAVRPVRTATDGPNLGSQVFVVGNPFGMGHSVSRGHVAALDRALELGLRQLGGLIQIQAPLYPGDSGGAVVNLHGDWLGLIRSGLARPRSVSTSESDASPGAPPPHSNSTASLSPAVSPNDVPFFRPERDTDFGFAIPARDDSGLPINFELKDVSIVHIWGSASSLCR